jgi:hypothetical protein
MLSGTECLEKRRLRRCRSSRKPLDAIRLRWLLEDVKVSMVPPSSLATMLAGNAAKEDSRLPLQRNNRDRVYLSHCTSTLTRQDTGRLV